MATLAAWRCVDLIEKIFSLVYCQATAGVLFDKEIQRAFDGFGLRLRSQNSLRTVDLGRV